MATELYAKLEKLRKLTETNLSDRYIKLSGHVESAVHASRKCYFDVALKQIILAQLEVDRLMVDAERRYVDGLIVKEELTDIMDDSQWLIFTDLVDTVTENIISSCECKKS